MASIRGGAVIPSVLRVQPAQRLGQRGHHRFGVLWRGPDVLVVLRRFMGVTLPALLLQRRHGVHHAQRRGAVVAEAGQYAVGPGVALAADVHEQVRAADLQYVRRGGLVGVDLHAGVDQQRGAAPIPQHLAGEVIAGEVRGDHVQAALGAGHRAQGQQQRRQQDQLLHIRKPHFEFQFQFHFRIIAARAAAVNSPWPPQQ